MNPARYDLRLRRGDTPLLMLRLWALDPVTRQAVLLPSETVSLAWRIDWPGGARTLRSLPGGGLKVDARTGLVAYPVASADLADLGDRTVAFRVQTVTEDGRVETFLEGTLAQEGEP
jgi:hypothetical protein